jgi:D-amino-acid dehydrogenase
MERIVIIGGGIVGLSSAYYLRRAGCEVIVLDQGDFLDNCSHGNMGYLSPSHYVPLASPGKVRQGLKWMFNAQSPFYIHFSPNPDLIDWGFRFLRKANAAHTESSAIPLRDIMLLSQREYSEWSALPEFDFGIENKGLLEIFRTGEARKSAAQIVQLGHRLGLDVELLDENQLQQLEMGTALSALGAIHFKCDAHVYPNHLMRSLREVLTQQGVQLLPHRKITQLDCSGGKIQRVRAGDEEFTGDQVVLAAGSWSKKLAASVNVSLPLMPGRGYSFDIEDGAFQLNHPAILMERSVALTPLNADTMRFGGTMEITPIGTPPRHSRVQGIVNAVNEYFPSAHLQAPPLEEVWFGYRPCSADGLPYIGRVKSCSNLLIATGHSMLGLAMGAGTGKLVMELATGQKPSIDMKPFAVERFG